MVVASTVTPSKILARRDGRIRTWQLPSESNLFRIGLSTTEFVPSIQSSRDSSYTASIKEVLDLEPERLHHDSEDLVVIHKRRHIHSMRTEGEEIDAFGRVLT